MKFKEHPIYENNPAHKELRDKHQEQEQRVYRGKENFGRLTVFRYDAMQKSEDGAYYGETLEQSQERLRERIEENKEHLSKTLRFSLEHSGNFFIRMYRSGMREDLLRLGLIEQDEHGKDRLSDDAFDPEKVKAIPNEDFIKMLQLRCRIFEEENKRFNDETVPSLKKAFFSQLENSFLVKKGLLSIEKAQEELARLQFELADELENISFRKDPGTGREAMYTTMGSHRPGIYKMTVGFEQTAKEKDLIRTAFHEFIHVTFGNSYKFSSPKMETATSGDSVYLWQDKVTTERSGLMFTPTRERKRQAERFLWLNEAITEMCAKGLVWFESDDKAYLDEMKLLQLLRFSGSEEISAEAILRAATERKMSDEDGRRGVESWRSLSKLINRAYEPGFLVRLDEYIKEFGPEKAVADWEDLGWRVIYDYESEEKKKRKPINQERTRLEKIAAAKKKAKEETEKLQSQEKTDD